MIEALEELKRRGPQKPQTLPDALDSFAYTKGKLVDPSQAQIVQGWTNHPAWRPKDQLRTRPGFVDVAALEATEPGAELTFSFRGRAVGILVPAGGDVGMLTYQVDDLPARQLDQWTKWSHLLHLPWLYTLEDELPPGPHTLRLTIADEKNAGSKGHACRIFAFAVNE